MPAANVPTPLPDGSTKACGLLGLIGGLLRRGHLAIGTPLLDES
jgi:hypothetical protein